MISLETMERVAQENGRPGSIKEACKEFDIEYESIIEIAHVFAEGSLTVFLNAMTSKGIDPEGIPVNGLLAFAGGSGFAHGIITGLKLAQIQTLNDSIEGETNGS